MRSISLILFILVYFSVCGQRDSVSITKKNMVEVGVTSASFFDGKGIVYPTFGSNAFSSLYQVNLNYSRTMDNVSPFIQIEGFYKNYNIKIDNTTKKGETTSRYFAIAKIGVKSSNLIHLQDYHHITVGASVNYRYGEEEILLGYFTNGFDYVSDGTQYNSIGFGSHLDYYYLIFDRITFGLRTGFDYYLQKPSLQSEPVGSDFYKSYKPNRAIFSLQPRIGFKF